MQHYAAHCSLYKYVLVEKNQWRQQGCQACMFGGLQVCTVQTNTPPKTTKSILKMNCQTVHCMTACCQLSTAHYRVTLKIDQTEAYSINLSERASRLNVEAMSLLMSSCPRLIYGHKLLLTHTCTHKPDCAIQPSICFIIYSSLLPRRNHNCYKPQKHSHKHSQHTLLWSGHNGSHLSWQLDVRRRWAQKDERRA